MNTFYKNLSMWLIIGLTMILLFNVFNKPQSQDSQKTYSEFWSSVESRDISRVTIQGEKILGTDQDGRPFTTVVPADTELIPMLREHGVDISVKEPDQTPWYFTIFVSWFPMLLLIGVWIFFMRQMQMGDLRAGTRRHVRHRLAPVDPPDRVRGRHRRRRRGDVRHPHLREGGVGRPHARAVPGGRALPGRDRRVPAPPRLRHDRDHGPVGRARRGHRRARPPHHGQLDLPGRASGGPGRAARGRHRVDPDPRVLRRRRTRRAVADPDGADRGDRRTCARRAASAAGAADHDRHRRPARVRAGERPRRRVLPGGARRRAAHRAGRVRHRGTARALRAVGRRMGGVPGRPGPPDRGRRSRPGRGVVGGRSVGVATARGHLCGPRAPRRTRAPDGDRGVHRVGRGAGTGPARRSAGHRGRRRPGAPRRGPRCRVRTGRRRGRRPDGPLPGPSSGR